MILKQKEIERSSLKLSSAKSSGLKSYLEATNKSP